jgi:glycerol-3-phosphate acyltransferase PlsY
LLCYFALLLYSYELFIFMNYLFFALIVAATYCLGSLSFAVIISQLMKLPNPHTYGSGNPGATNVLRSGNKIAAILTLVLDAAKGWLAVSVVQYIATYSLLNLTTNQHQYLIGLSIIAVFLGHLFPIFYRFKGGKGVATAAGILIAIQPLLGGLTVLTWLIVALIFRYSSLSALTSAVFAAIYSSVWLGLSPIGLAILIISSLLIWRHTANIQNLLAGQEKKIGKK